jgi:beta-N-acetylhexosaminidase
VNLAPVCDVNSNPNNIIIGKRSFGNNPYLVASHAAAFASGLQAGGVMACGKHFPGHGDVEIDSHIALPTVWKTKEELRAMEFIPFQKVIDDGIGCIMTGHLNIPYIDAIEILRDEMGFEGLIISDAMNMGAVKECDALRYLQKGHDMLLYGDHIAPKVDAILHELIPRAYEAVLQAVLSGELTIDDKVERIEVAKRMWLKPRESGALNTQEALALLQELRAL